MKRREFNRLVGGSVVAAQLGLLADWGRGDDVAEPASAAGAAELRAALDKLAESLAGIEYIGPVCDRRLGVADPLGELLEIIDGYRGTLVEALRTQFSKDFGSGDVVDIDGWRLSRSECLLVAGSARLKGLSEAQTASAGEFRDQKFIDIEKWGPDRTVEGQIFNPIGNGRGGFWLRVNGQVNGSMRLELDGVEMTTHFEPGVITASLEPDFMDRIIGKPGIYELALVDKSRRLRQTVGFLTVAERPPMATLADGSTSTVFCTVDRWGPSQAVAGEAFNRQPDGSAAFWVRIGCAPPGAVLVLDGVELPTVVRSELVTARVPHFADLPRGQYPLELFDRASGERLLIGALEIQ